MRRYRRPKRPAPPAADDAFEVRQQPARQEIVHDLPICAVPADDQDPLWQNSSSRSIDALETEPRRLRPNRLLRYAKPQTQDMSPSSAIHALGVVSSRDSISSARGSGGGPPQEGRTQGDNPHIPCSGPHLDGSSVCAPCALRGA